MKCKQTFLLVNLRPHMMPQGEVSQDFVVLVGLIAFFILFVIFVRFVIALIRFAITLSKLKREVREVSSQTYQSIWGFEAIGNGFSRLMSFLESNNLNEHASVANEKAVCYKAAKKMTRLFSIFILFILGMVLIFGTIAIIQSF